MDGSSNGGALSGIGVVTARAYDLPWAAIAACPTPLAAAFDHLDVRLAAAARRVRARESSTLDELRGVVVGHDRVESLLHDGRRSHGAGALVDERAPPLSDNLLVHPAWRALSQQLAPHPIERDLVLLVLARELFAHYEPVFGYLNDDLTRRAPSRGLVVQLLARNEHDAAILAGAMAIGAPLVQAGVLRLFELSPNDAMSATGIGLSSLATALLGNAPQPWRHLPPEVEVEAEPELAAVDDALLQKLAALASAPHPASDSPLIVLEGRRGAGRTTLARALAATRGCPLLHVSIGSWCTSEGSRTSDARADALRDAVLYQQLADAVILLDGVDAWCADDQPAHRRQPWPGALAHATGPVLLRVDTTTRWQAPLHRQRVARFVFPALAAQARAGDWRRALAGHPLTSTDDHAIALVLADRFDITPGEIRRVVTQVADEQVIADVGAGDGEMSVTQLTDALSAATRARSRDALGALAVLAPTPHTWDDLVLPVTTLRRLQEFARAVRDRSIVLDAWQFSRCSVRSRGATALFAGASGTGKTMACGVIARELGLDLFVIDLSAVVSKYIGETEKNLDRVFRAARDAGAVLFFDEADALFGKRSEVKDAHDRYANIEVAYLLQQLDAHDGIVVLATNLARNLDAAFSRRMRYVVEFPLPGDADRLRLWRGVIPTQAPLSSDVDLEFLARAFPMAGGDIRNVALDAAYLAASDGAGREPITMSHFVTAMARQCVKQGITPSAAQFRQYAGMLPRYG